MKDKDYIKDLFNEKLNGFEAEVRPELWANISSQIGAAATTSVTTGLSLVTKTIIGFSIAAAVSGVTFFILKDENPIKTIQKQTKSVTIEEKESVDDLEKSNKNNLRETKKSIGFDVVESDKKAEFVNKENTISPLSIIVPASNIEKQIVTLKEETKNILQQEKKETANLPSVESNKQTNKEEAVVDNIVQLKTIEITKEELIEDKSIGSLTNVFTPNGDNINDFLTIESTGLTDFSIVVIDNNSKIVFQSTEANFQWDGNYMNGEIAPVGNYVYYITARNSKGDLITKHSNLRIQR